MVFAIRHWMCCVLLAATIPVASAEGVAADRRGLIQSGHAAWLVQGGPLSPLEAEATRDGDAYVLTIRGMYPIMDVTGKFTDPASQIAFWVSRGTGKEIKYLAEYNQVVKGSWRSGDSFVATLKVARSVIEGRDPAYIGICMGTPQSCWPGTNLSPP